MLRSWITHRVPASSVSNAWLKTSGSVPGKSGAGSCWNRVTAIVRQFVQAGRMAVPKSWSSLSSHRFETSKMNIRFFRQIAFVLVIWAAHEVASATSSISQLPLLNSRLPPPNIMLIMDDSESMMQESMPDGLIEDSWPMFPQTYATSTRDTIFASITPLVPMRAYYSGRTLVGYFHQSLSFDDELYVAQRRCAQINTIYYNPEVNYRPWLNSDGTEMAAASPTAAYWDPMHPELTRGTVNLADQQSLRAFWFDSAAGSSAIPVVRSFYMGTYYTLNYTIDSSTGARIYADKNLPSSYVRHVIKPANDDGSIQTFAKAAARTDCGGSTCTYAEEMQNFANWFQYYRTRLLVARGAVGAAFASQSENQFRLGYTQTSHSSTTSIDGVATPRVTMPVRPFGGGDRTAVMRRLYAGDLGTDGSTPLLTTLHAVGSYFSRDASTDIGSPWRATPGTASNDAPLSCRRSYAVLITDGYWNDSVSLGDVDNENGPVIGRSSGTSETHYEPIAPYAGPSSQSTLADVAMYYWNRDLQPTMENAVQPTTGDSAFWQHLSLFTVGMGVNGSRDPSSDLAALTWNDPWSWDSTRGANLWKIDDLWHAAVNARGGYYSATNPSALKGQMESVLAEINDANGSTAGSISESRVYSDSSGIFYSNYDPTYWSGDLEYYRLRNATSSTNGSMYWAASEQLPIPDRRSIYTKNSTNNTVELFWDNLGDDQKAALGNDSGVIDYLRGVTEFEVGKRPVTVTPTSSSYSSYRFRTRRTEYHHTSGIAYTNVLGDILDSSVALVGNGDDYAYDLLPSGVPGQSTYLSTLSGSFASRRKMIYIGSNDGMLHGFDASAQATDSHGNKVGGVEKFAYMPKSVLGNIYAYTQPGYSHRMFVDGSLEIGDAYLTIGGTGAWRTILLGATGAGGKTIFALDVSDPSQLGASSVLWEKSASDSGYEALGYTIAASRIGVVNTDQGHKWVALVPNGYESASLGADASLSARAQLLVLNLDDGSILKRIDTNSGDGSHPNGLGSIEVRVDDNRRIIAAYAGDKLGNLWKFDLSSLDPEQWGVSGDRPIFTGAVVSGSTSTPQPITARPALWRLDDGRVAVVFGTGKLFEIGDGSTTQASTQTIYAIVDQARSSSLLRSNLVPISSASVTNAAGSLVGVTITSEKVDLSTASGWYLDIANLPGERVIAQPTAIAGIAYVTSFAPSSTTCEFGGSSILYAINIATGGATDISQFTVTDGLQGVSNCSDGSCLSGLKILGTTSGLSYLFRQTTDNTRGLTAIGASTGMQQINQTLGGSVLWRRGNWREITQ